MTEPELTPGRLRSVTPAASVMLAPNPSYMTLDGTNTWVLRGPQAGPTDGFIVVDAGPTDEDHLARVAALGRIELIPAHPRPPRPQRRLGPARRADRGTRPRTGSAVRRAAGGR